MRRSWIVAATLVSFAVAALLLVPAGDLGSTSVQRAAPPAPPVAVCDLLEDVLGSEATVPRLVVIEDPPADRTIEIRHPDRGRRLCDAPEGVALPTPSGTIRLTELSLGIATMADRASAEARASTRVSQIVGFTIREVDDDRALNAGYIRGNLGRWQISLILVIDEYMVSFTVTFEKADQPVPPERAVRAFARQVDEAQIDPDDWIED